MRTSLHTYLSTRGRLVVLAAGVGVALRLGQSFPDERSLDGVHSLLSQAAHGQASAGAWEPSRGAVLDLIDGRPFLFLSRSSSEAPHDLQRAFIRVSPDGAPLSLTRTRNLTSTAVADEQGLLVKGPHAAFATVAYDEVQGVTLLDSRGAPPAPETGLLRRALAAFIRAVDDFRETGSVRGLARIDLEPSPRPPGLRMELAQDALTLQSSAGAVVVAGLEAPGQARVATKDTNPDGGARAKLTPFVRVPRARPVGQWLTETGQELLGDPAATWLAMQTLSLRDFVRRTSHGFGASSLELRDDARSAASTPSAPSDETAVAGDVWPPKDIPSIWKNPRPDEGRWQPIDLLGKAAHRDKEPPLFYRTSLNPDRERPDFEVVLVVMDTRRLELGMEGGYATPHPSVGLPGHGQIPSDPHIYRRIVATFNGASNTRSSENGMTVDGRVLVPPTPNAATVLVDRAGRVGIGIWPSQDPPRGVVSLRQGKEPLLESGRVVPAHDGADATVTERTALCVTRAGQLVYAWSERATRHALAEALRMASCVSAAPLASGFSHGTFLFTDIVNIERNDARALALDVRMTGTLPLPGGASPADFFYLALRERVPRAAHLAWQIDPGAQPSPEGMPGIFSAREELGSLTVELTRFDSGRFSWRLGPSRAEATSVVADTELAPEKASLVLAALGLGHTTDRTRAGLTAGGRQLVPLQRALATLILPAEAEPYVVPAGVPVSVPDGADAVQLPVLTRDGQLTQRARELGGLRKRGALCIDEQGNLLVARMQHDSSASVARALLEVGCQLILELDRGSHSAPFVERPGTPSDSRSGSLRSTDASTVLYALGRDASPRAYSGMPPR